MSKHEWQVLNTETRQPDAKFANLKLINMRKWRNWQTHQT
jgi:hypothetical protein